MARLTSATCQVVFDWIAGLPPITFGVAATSGSEVLRATDSVACALSMTPAKIVKMIH
jgi:hypothetical protein